MVKCTVSFFNIRPGKFSQSREMWAGKLCPRSSQTPPPRALIRSLYFDTYIIERCQLLNYCKFLAINRNWFDQIRLSLHDCKFVVDSKIISAIFNLVSSITAEIFNLWKARILTGTRSENRTLVGGWVFIYLLITHTPLLICFESNCNLIRYQQGRVESMNIHSLP